MPTTSEAVAAGYVAAAANGSNHLHPAIITVHTDVREQLIVSPINGIPYAWSRDTEATLILEKGLPLEAYDRLKTNLCKEIDKIAHRWELREPPIPERTNHEQA